MKTFSEGFVIGAFVSIGAVCIFMIGWLASATSSELDCDNYGKTRLDSGYYYCKRVEKSDS